MAGMEHLFRGIPFSQEDEIQECALVSLMLRRKTLLVVTIRFYRFSTGAFCLKSPILTGRNGRLKPGRLLNLTEHTGKKSRQFPILLFDIQGSSILETMSLLLPCAL